MKFDLDKHGLEAVFKPWQVKALLFLLHPLVPRGSREVHQAIPEVSRASVIFFLDKMVEEGLLTYTMTTGKGGWRRLYSFKPGIRSLGELRMWLYTAIVKHAQNELLTT